MEMCFGGKQGEAPVLWPPVAKNWLIGKDHNAGKDWRREEKGMTEDDMVGWHHWLDGHEWVNSGSWWWTGNPGILQSVGSQRPTRLTDWTKVRFITLRIICSFNKSLKELKLVNNIKKIKIIRWDWTRRTLSWIQRNLSSNLSIILRKDF